MRIWDVSPAYLNRQSLLGEHRELHGLASILIHGKKGYARHPETLRWIGCMAALIRRHAWLAAEMHLRGYRDRSPVFAKTSTLRWPSIFVTQPAVQFELLRMKYRGREPGRIRLPDTAGELWAQHKYSVMARDPGLYRTVGRRVARLRRRSGFNELATELVEILQREPGRGRLTTALEHLWGYVNEDACAEDKRCAQRSPAAMIETTQRLAMRSNQQYLMASTALSDLAAFVETTTAIPPVSR